MNKYQIEKAKAREKAIEWQREAAERSMSWGELAEYQAYFEDIGKRYGLLTEFRENGIC